MIDSPPSNVRFYFNSVENCCNRSGMLTVTLQAELAGIRPCWWNRAENPICKKGRSDSLSIAHCLKHLHCSAVQQRALDLIVEL